MVVSVILRRDVYIDESLGGYTLHRNTLEIRPRVVASQVIYGNENNCTWYSCETIHGAGAVSQQIYTSVGTSAGEAS